MFQKSVSGYNEEYWLARGLSYADQLNFLNREALVTWPRGGRMNSKLSMDSKEGNTDRSSSAVFMWSP